MLNDAAGFKRIFIAAGYTDLRDWRDESAGEVLGMDWGES